jgi:hypothetical protein
MYLDTNIIMNEKLWENIWAIFGGLGIIKKGKMTKIEAWLMEMILEIHF